MDNIRIETTQNVDIEYEVASVGDRILATLLDYLFFLAYLLLIGILAAIIGSSFIDSWAIISLIVLPILLYDLLCETFLQGRSFGKIMMKIKVVKIDGTQATFGSYLIRWLLRIVDTRIFGGVIALIVILANGKGQRVGDMAAGTTVIKMKQKVQLSDTILNNVIPDYTLVFSQVSKLSDNDIAIIKDVMNLCLKTGNTEALSKLAAKTKTTMGVDVNMPDIQFLNTVLQDYSYWGAINQ
ncbi:MAG: RDD family protein [Bacteroidia bacterium]